MIASPPAARVRQERREGGKKTRKKNDVDAKPSSKPSTHIGFSHYLVIFNQSYQDDDEDDEEEEGVADGSEWRGESLAE